MALSITNWNFTSTTGMSNTGGWWYGWTSPGWSYTWAGSSYVVNNGIMNLDAMGTLSQSMWTVVAGWEVVTVTFQYADNWNWWYYAASQNMCTIELYDVTTSTVLATKTVADIAAYQTFTSNTVSATCVVWHTISIRFTALYWTWAVLWYACAIDNISVAVAAWPSSSSFLAFF
jgi:hypothetical protein